MGAIWIANQVLAPNSIGDLKARLAVACINWGNAKALAASAISHLTDAETRAQQDRTARNRIAARCAELESWRDDILDAIEDWIVDEAMDDPATAISTPAEFQVLEQARRGQRERAATEAHDHAAASLDLM